MEPTSSQNNGEDIRELPQQLDRDSVQLLMSEFERLSSAFIYNEESGERRLSLFLTLIAAVTAAVALVLDNTGEQMDVRFMIRIIAGASTVLLLFGLVTLRRIMVRNIATAEYLNGLRLIRAYFGKRQPDVVKAMQFVPSKDRPVRSKDPLKIGKSGLLETVGTVNCILAGTAAGGASWLVLSSQWSSVSVALVTIPAVWLLQMCWASRVYFTSSQEGEQERDAGLEWWRETFGNRAPPPKRSESDDEAFRAGVGLIVVRDDGRVLALERSDIPGAWQLPQGGLKVGEEPEAAAWRELKEETGLSEAEVELKTASEYWVGYELPESTRNPKTGRGQVHRWFVFRLRPDRSIPPLPVGATAEFNKYQWVEFGNLSRQAVDFRKPVYKLLAAWLTQELQQQLD